MNKEFYEVWIDDSLIAAHLSKEIALLLIDAIFTKFYNDPTLTLTINREINND